MNKQSIKPDKVRVWCLENDCYYIGTEIPRDLKWTRIHQPVRIFKTYPLDTNIDNLVRTYMVKYGVSKVRGGQYLTSKEDGKITIKDKPLSLRFYLECECYPDK